MFGGGHVVLPLLDQAVVEPGWVGQQEFLAGYGLVQAMPGPLFTFSAYLGAIQGPEPNGLAGAALALVAIFLPSFLLLGGLLPVGRSSARAGRPGGARRGGRGGRRSPRRRVLGSGPHASIDGVGDAAFAVEAPGARALLPIWAVVPLAAGLGALVL